MKTFAFLFALVIAAIGLVGIVAPALLVGLAQQFTNAGPFYLLAVVRIAFGLLLIRVAPESRLPRALRAVGCIVIVLGLGAALAGSIALPQARAAIEVWEHQGPIVERLSCVFVLALGSFIAYACAPRKTLA